MNWNEWFYYDETSPTCLRRKKVNDSDRKSKVGDVAGGVGGDGYFITRHINKKIVCHRIIWQLHNGPISDKQKIDHIDRNRLNNKIENLRLVTNSQNGANSNKSMVGHSKYKGVTFHKRANKWQTRITVNRNQINIGYFGSENEAAEMYDNAAVFYFGEFANLNFGLDGYKKRCQDLLPS